MKTRAIPLPPMPADTMVCRWCGGPKAHLSTRTVCQAGCAPDGEPTSGPRKCGDCGGTFETGERFPGDQCWQCRDAELGRARAATFAGGRPVTGYLKEQRLSSAVARDQRAGNLPTSEAR